MASDLIKRDDSARRLDRSKCVFPASSTASTPVARATIKVLLARRHRDSATTTPDIALPTVLKAAWVLTLQCFIIADIICFKYNGAIEGEQERENDSQLHNEESKDISLLYITRVDPNELVRSFLRRFHQCRASASATDPTDYDIGVVGEHSSHHHCNTAICFRKQEAEQEESTSISNTNLEVSMRYLRPVQC